ncbi:hypothetical protein BGZ80_006872 [Entomortierella chlamydospora]|uniref:CCHC-type domain-containing protein n=1 Tax=Entomortierella chlamydospora TaxID=101097 RepID=A0A9P6MZZ2_9FUNG|nr:hypothetical protein BGZ80_006872 [Entomortierella chlamydospora]
MQSTSDSDLTPQWISSNPFVTSTVVSSSGLSATNSWDAPVGVPSTPSVVASASEVNQSFQSLQNELSKQMESTSISNDRPPISDSHSPERSSSPRPAPGAPTLTLEEVWPKFLEADQTRDLDDVKPALAQLCEAYRGQSWTDIEKKLREENCNTYLVATMDTVSFGYTLVNLKGEPRQEFRVIPSFIKPGTVKKGRMAIGMASSYEENLSRLDRAGVVRPSGIPKCHNCKQDGHVVSDCPEGRREVEKSEYFGKCYNCGSEDHRTRTCPEPRKVITCRNCNQEGHMAKDCLEPPAPVICKRCGEPGHMCNEAGHRASECTNEGYSNGRGGGGERRSNRFGFSDGF